MSSKSSMAKKIKALFAKARNEAASEAERDIFLAKANELMVKHALSETDFDPDDHEMVWAVLPTKSGPYGVRGATLGSTIARHFGVFSFRSGGGRFGRFEDDGFYTRGNKSAAGVEAPKGSTVLCGKAANVFAVKAMWTELLADMTAGATELEGFDRGSTLGLRRGFMDGYIKAIYDRLKELRTTADRDNDGRLLPVLASDRKAAESWTGLEFSSGTSYRAGSAAGASYGSAAGSRANLSGGKSFSGRRALNA